MILRTSTTFDSFLNQLAVRVTGERRYGMLIEGNHRIAYLGAGYWRALIVDNEKNEWLGVRLINPDRTFDEIETVEKGVAILLFAKWQPNV